jgi:hypothetical protein
MPPLEVGRDVGLEFGLEFDLEKEDLPWLGARGNWRLGRYATGAETVRWGAYRTEWFRYET